MKKSLATILGAAALTIATPVAAFAFPAKQTQPGWAWSTGSATKQVQATWSTLPASIAQLQSQDATSSAPQDVTVDTDAPAPVDTTPVSVVPQTVSAPVAMTLHRVTLLTWALTI